MNTDNHYITPQLSKHSKIWLRLFSIWMIVAIAIPSQALSAAPVAQSAAVTVAQVQPKTVMAAPTSTITLSVISARTEPRFNAGAGVTKGTAAATYKWMINVDNAGTTEQRSPLLGTGCSAQDPGYPLSCHWPSIGSEMDQSPIYSHGDQTTLNTIAGLTLPAGRYLISVLADGYKIDGAHFTVPLEAPGLVTVEVQPNPLPDSTLRALVFADNALTNGTQDVPAEPGLAGFQGHIVDYLGPVTTDVYGNPLCTRYEGEDPVSYVIPASFLDADMAPIPIPGTGVACFSDADGMLVIPHLGTNRYALSVTPPPGQVWIQTTTLEGNHDWDTWLMEGSTGFDTEFVQGGEPVPQQIFGFVQAINNLTPGAAGHIKGSVANVKHYTPSIGGIYDFWGGHVGAKVGGMIDSPWLSLGDLQNGDAAVWVGQGNPDGSFDIPNIPDGNYSLSWWDEPQDYNLNFINVTVANGETVDMGVIPLNGWWTQYDGYVFNDTNRNGVKDPGEPGVPNFTLTLRRRENSLMDRGGTLVTTDQDGYYFIENGYPLGEFLILEAYNEAYYTTGLTYQADNQPTPTTVLGHGVDISTLPIIGLSGRVDWGVHAYDATGASGGVDLRNGGIVGTVSYDTTRNELDPRYAVAEDWQPGVSGVTVDLYKPVPCGTHPGTPCDTKFGQGFYELAPDGSYAKSPLLNTYVSEAWARPTGCIARDVDGNPLTHGPNGQENVLVDPANPDGICIESFMQEVQFAPYATGQGTPDANFGAAVNGNYGFGDYCTGTLDATDPANPVCNGGTFESLTAGDYLVEVEISPDNSGAPMYNVTREEDINIGNGDQIIPQLLPSACAGPLHTVDVSGMLTDTYPVNSTFIPGVTVPASTPTDNATFVDLGGSPYEGTPMPLCQTKLVRVTNGRSVTPIFHLFTDVPIPARLKGMIVDDTFFSTDKRSTMYGEKSGVPFAPIGVYDFNNRLVTTLESDFNGVYDVLLPSTNHISCPTPSGVCANMYRFVGNDPGVPGRLNPNWHPEYRTIATEFEAFPGLIIPTDLAPTQVGLRIEGPSGLLPATCALDAATPQLFAVSKPYGRGGESFTIQGFGFGATRGTGTVRLDAGIPLVVNGWSNTLLTVTVPAGTAIGPHQLTITSGNGQSTVNGLTYHVLGSPAFPATNVLDNFNRANNTALGNNWTPSPTPGWGIVSNRAVARTGSGGAPIRRNTTFAANQEAYFTFVITTTVTAATDQGLVLKRTGTNSMIVVSYHRAANTVTIETRDPANGRVVRFTIPGVSFANGDRFGARTLQTGLVLVYKNAALIGSFNVSDPALTNPWPANLASGTGQIGVWFVGATNANPATIDDFGGGSVSASQTYEPNVYEVGPGRTYSPVESLPLVADHAIQNALDDAAVSPGDDLVVVYPNLPSVDPRQNPRGAYYENLIIHSPVKLQGVGPGGFQGAVFVPGSILDGGAFGGDSPVATDWYTLAGSLLWDGNQAVNDGEVIYVLASQNNTTAAGRARQFTSNFRGGIDGFDIRGGDQMGFPGNINDLTGQPTGLPPGIVTQGGAIFVNAYARYLQITNNVVQNNGGSYGTIRVGTPDLPAPDTDQQNENIRIANNRVIANGGTNLAGGIGIFAGADNYEVALNDLCGNFSFEYGGGLSQYGYSPNGSIHNNRIYFNQSNDEGGGIMIAGQLSANPGVLSPGSGPVNIYSNQIQANNANDDGGGIRFLMAGNYTMNVYNNMIVNNVSTHEGGGLSLNDAPNVRVYNNTIMKNITTATAVTSSGLPAPAGLSTSANSFPLQDTLPAGSPTFSNPLLFNNIFWDNRAGTRAGLTVLGIGLAGDLTPIDQWDLGVADDTGVLAPTNSVVQQNGGAHPYTASPTNRTTDPQVTQVFSVTVSLAVWAQNPAFAGATLVTTNGEVPPNLMGNYHLLASSPAVNAGAASKSGVNAPNFDFDGDVRPSSGGYEIGADERRVAGAGLAGLARLGTAALRMQELGPEWFGDTGSFTNTVVSGTISVLADGNIYWGDSQFGPSQEASITYDTMFPATVKQGVILKFNGFSVDEGTLIEVFYDDSTQNVMILTLDPAAGPPQSWPFIGAVFAPDDVLGAQALEDGRVIVYQNGTEIHEVNVYDTNVPGADAWLVDNGLGGLIGVTYDVPDPADGFTPGDASFRSFGGGDVAGPSTNVTIFLPFIVAP